MNKIGSAIGVLVATSIISAGDASAQQQICGPASGPSGICATIGAGDWNNDGSQDFPVVTIDGIVGPGIAMTAGGLIPIIDPVTGLQKTDPMTGNPLFSQPAIIPVSEAYGNNATALGNGARVGAYIPHACSGGNTLVSGKCYANDQLDANGQPIVGAVDAPSAYVPAHTAPAHNGTALGAGAVVDAGHHNSTAVGSGAKTTRANQVMVGTDKEDVTIASLPGKVDKSTKTVVVHQADGTLASDGGQIYGTLSTHNSQIAALESLTATQGAAINAHSALLSQHSKRLDSVEKGVAISMSLPDAWLGEKERFAIMGNIGGFGGETAIGLGAVARIDQNWSVNAKFGADTEFEEFGWSLGARAGF